MSVKLKPCPFCGNSDRKKFSIDRAWSNSFVRCWTCNATGPWQYDGGGNTPATRWNRRALAAQEKQP